MNDGTITAETFFREVVTFRKIVGDKRNSITFMDKAYACLYLITNRVDPKDPRKELTEQSWAAATEEFIRRKALLIMNGHPIE